VNGVDKLQRLCNSSRMNATASRKPKQDESWPRKVTVGRETVAVYRRKTPLGNFAYMVANYSGKKRRFDSYASAADAIEAAGRLARRLSETDTKAAQMTEEQAVEYINSARELQPLGITLTAAVAVIVEAVKLTGDLPGVVAAARSYKAKHKTITPKRVADAVAELIKLKESRGAAARYVDDLRWRLEKFAEKFPCNIASITTPDLQTWLDGLKLSSQSYANNRRVAHLLFEYAVARGYCLDNPAAEVERPKIRNGEIEIFTPDETRKLLAASAPDFLPCIVLGMFAGLRSAEIARMEWQDIDLKQGHIVVSASNAKTASRRIVPVSDNLAVWLAPYAKQTGLIWKHTATDLQRARAETVKASGVAWKSNGCRHSFASYSFALCADAGRVAGYCGNSPAMIHKHYKQLCTPADAQKFFSVKPATAVNVLPATAIANP
jgi:integrase